MNGPRPWLRFWIRKGPCGEEGMKKGGKGQAYGFIAWKLPGGEWFLGNAPRRFKFTDGSYATFCCMHSEDRYISDEEAAMILFEAQDE